MAPIVAVREFYRRRDMAGAVKKQSKRSRKSALLYAGADSLFAITEGNPRWFIGIVGRLLSTPIHNDRIDLLPQADEIVRAGQQFAAMLRTIPVSRHAGSGAPQGVLSNIRVIGRFFHNQVVKEDFRPEPPGTFIVDATHLGISDDLLDSLGKALNAGALVYVPDDEGQLILNSLRGKRFRLSYLLASIYELPIRLGNEVALTTVLRTYGTDAHQRLRDESTQLPFPEQGGPNE
jgi:hypothetical protein